MYAPDGANSSARHGMAARAAAILAIWAPVVLVAGCGSDSVSRSPATSRLTQTVISSPVSTPTTNPATNTAGGGGDLGDGGPAGDQRPPLTPQPSPPAPTPTSPGTVDPSTYAVGDRYYFISPSGLFSCGILAPSTPGASNGAGCQGDTSPIPPKPSSCRLSWGHGIRVNVGAAPEFLCVSDVQFAPADGTPARVLGYGQTLQAYDFSCTVLESGITCRQNSTGRGFTIARETNRLF
ncbi:DUF6636 domain-containing protein [Williamsia sp. CHRR-6]|uniref:DUF6636 domain-containing protein n=1 Tax=Williamsia sp. CHRR-6 TaxID=2835871 RepID=UPI001BD93235|nr:DUF6636 domain-containing protein [Williamsia sp. CHRR-6]MBT0566493.1 hypothetical protein [Williamsia sp. CHRR-6]